MLKDMLNDNSSPFILGAPFKHSLNDTAAVLILGKLDDIFQAKFEDESDMLLGDDLNSSLDNVIAVRVHHHFLDVFSELVKEFDKLRDKQNVYCLLDHTTTVHIL
ncbi:hypothetical protein HG530_003631 [Fusarium avenaceum]|nr:hypothetical protein HG530_003631 [Fusarium avenaceum]